MLESLRIKLGTSNREGGALTNCATLLLLENLTNDKESETKNLVCKPIILE